MSSKPITFGNVPPMDKLADNPGKPAVVYVQRENRQLTAYGTPPFLAKDLVNTDIYRRLLSCLIRDDIALATQLSHYSLFTKLRKHPITVKLGYTSLELIVQNASALLNMMEEQDVEVFVKEEAALTPVSIQVIPTAGPLIPDASTVIPPVLVPAVDSVLRSTKRVANPPSVRINPTMPVTLGLDNEIYNLSRFLFSRGDLLECQALTDEITQGFLKDFTSALPRISDEGHAPEEVDILNVVCCKDEDLAALTPLNVMQTAVQDIYELCDGDVILAVIRRLPVEVWIPQHMETLAAGSTSTPFTMALGRVNCVTPGALAYMVERRQTDSIFNQADVRWMLGLDPLFAECWPGMKVLISMLYDHRADIWSRHNKMSVRAGLLDLDPTAALSRTQLLRMCYRLVGPDKWYSSKGVYSASGRGLLMRETYDRVRLAVRHGQYKDQEATVRKEMFDASHRNSAEQQDVILKLETENAELKKSLNAALQDVLESRRRIESITEEMTQQLQVQARENEIVNASLNAALATAQSIAGVQDMNIMTLANDGKLLCLADQSQLPTLSPVLSYHWETMVTNGLRWRAAIEEACSAHMATNAEEMAFQIANDYEDRVDTLERSIKELREELKRHQVLVSEPTVIEPLSETASISSTNSTKKQVIWSHAQRREPAPQAHYHEVKAQRESRARSDGWGVDGDIRIFGEGATTERVSHAILPDVMPRVDSDDDWDPAPGAYDDC